MKGGIDLGIGTILSLIGVLIVGAFGFVFINSGGLDATILNFCAASGFCGNQTTYVSSTAFASTNALACAINSMGAGESLPCVDDLKVNSPNGPYVECIQQSDLVCCDIGTFSGEFWTSRNECKKKNYTPLTSKTEVCGKIYTEKKPELKCIVKNFELPQKLDEITLIEDNSILGDIKLKPSDWIKYYGDPKYLVYWQKFPKDQDTWTYQGDWKVHGVILAISVLPAGKVGRVLAGSGIAKALTKVSFLEEAGLKIGSKVAGQELGKATARQLLKDVLIKGSWERLKNEPLSVLKRLIVLETANKIASVADYASEYVDSVLNKYDTQPGKIVIKGSYSRVKPENLYQVEGKAQDIPLFVQFRPGITSDIRPLHMVSPCKVDNLPIKKAGAFCDLYSFNPDTKELGCLNPQYMEDINDDKDNSTCQDFNTYPQFENHNTQEFIDFLKSSLHSSPAFSSDYYNSGIAKVLIQKDISLQINKENKMVGDILIFETLSGEVKLPVIDLNKTSTILGSKTITSGGGNEFTPPETEYIYGNLGEFEYQDTKIEIEKFCYPEPGAGEMNCKVGLTVKSYCSQKTEVCEKINKLKTEKFTADHTWFFGFFGNKYEFNKFLTFKFDVDKKVGEKITTDNGRIIDIVQDNYLIRYTDSDNNNKIESIGIAKYAKPPEENDILNMVILSDSNDDGYFDTWGMTNCKTNALYADMLEADQRDGYCINQKGVLKSITTSTLTWGGYGLMAAGVVVGAVALVPVTGGGSLAIGSLALSSGTAGTLLYVGGIATSVGEFTDAVTGGWPGKKQE